jgi:hypothetical protein
MLPYETNIAEEVDLILEEILKNIFPLSEIYSPKFKEFSNFLNLEKCFHKKTIGFKSSLKNIFGIRIYFF